MHRIESAPSIGNIELHFDERGNRARQIVQEIIHDPQDLAPVLYNAHLFAEQNGATRRIVRSLTRSDRLDDAHVFAESHHWNIEGAMELAGQFTGFHFVYYGRNDNHRQSAPTVIAKEATILEQVLTRPVKPIIERIHQAHQSGFILEKLQPPLRKEDHERLIEMYHLSFSEYPFNIEEAIVGMIENEDTHVCAARSTQDGQLYAVAATEQVVVPLRDGRTLIMREMGDSAKMPEVNGLNAPLKLKLINESTKSGNVPDMIFCETRAALAAVNIINHSISMNYCGTLHKHTMISGPEDVAEMELDGEFGRYGNMHIWALNSDDVIRISHEVEGVLTP